MAVKNVCLPVFLLIQSMIRAGLGIWFLTITIKFWDCYPCACTSKEVWKRDVEVKFNQTFWLSCFAIEIESEKEPYVEMETIFYASTACTKNCTINHGFDSRLSNYFERESRTLSLIISSFIWISSSLIFIICGTFGVLFNIIPLIVIFLIYQVMDTILALSIISFTNSPFIEGNIFETFHILIFSEQSSSIHGYLHIILNLIQIIICFHVLQQLRRWEEKKEERKRRPSLRSKLV